MTISIEKETPSRPSPYGRSTRFVTVRANLLPDEVVSARQADAMRRRVLVGLAGVLVLLLLGFGVSFWQTHSAQNALTMLRKQGTALQAQTEKFAPLVNAQSETSTIDGQLTRLMDGDLSWRDMLTSLRAKAPKGIALTQVTGTVTSGAASTSGTTSSDSYDPLNTSGKASVGSLTLVGTAPDKGSVADYTDQLARTTGLTAPFVTSVTSDGHTVTFNVTVVVTSDALGGRWTPADSTTTVPAANVPSQPSTGGN